MSRNRFLGALCSLLCTADCIASKNLLAMCWHTVKSRLRVEVKMHICGVGLAVVICAGRNRFLSAVCAR
jgi:hypothetical protein